MTIPEPIAKWLDGITVLNFILWVAAIWATLTLAWKSIKRAIPAVKAMIELSESLQRLPDWMDTVDDKLEQVRHEVLPNNGGSMRDDVKTVSLQVEKLQAHQDKDFARLEALETTITRRLERQNTGEIATKE